MVRETRYLWVGNLPEKATEDDISEHFKRYGKIQSVRIHPRKEPSDGGPSCTVAFMDIKSASKAHNSENRIENSLLRTDYSEPTATGSVVTRTHEPEPLPHNTGPSRQQFSLPRGTPGFQGRPKGPEEGDRPDYHYGAQREGIPQYDNRFPNSTNYEEGAQYQARGRPRERTYPPNKGNYNKQFDRGPAQQRLGLRHVGYDAHNTQGEAFTGERFDRLRLQLSPGHSSAHSKKGSKQKGSVSVSRSPSGSRSRSSSSSSYSGSSSNTSGSRSRSRSSSSHSSHPAPQSNPSSKVLVRSDRSESVDCGVDKTCASSDTQLSGSEKRPLGICIRRLPLRSSDTSLRDGLFHEYKKHGKVTAIQVSGQAEDRYAIVSFRKYEDACKALEASQDKLFFGTKIQVTSHEGLEGEDSEFRPHEVELDEYHPKATRTLFVGNLEKDITTQELRDKFKKLGEIIDIDVKRQGAISAYAFVQYADITSVVKALRTMDGEHVGANKIKLGFGKSMPTNCVWLDGLSDQCTERFLCRQFSRFGGISHSVIDKSRHKGLVYFDTMETAQVAVNEMRSRIFFNTKIQIDFASRDCQTKFFEKMEKSGLLRPGERPDERGGRLYKQQQQGFEFYNEPFRDETAGAFEGRTFTAFEGTPTATRARRVFRARGGTNRGTFRGRGRAGKTGFFPEGTQFPQTDEFRERRPSRHADDDFSQGSGSFVDDSYERELREYGVSQRARERGSSATRRHGDRSPSPFYEGQRRRESVEEQFEERFKDSYSDNYHGSESPVSQRDAYEDRFGFRPRFFEDKLHSRERLSDRERRKEGSRDHSADNDSSGQYSGSRTPVPRHSESLSPPPVVRDLQKENILPRARTPPTPTQEEPPIYSACQDSVMDLRESDRPQEQRRKFSKSGEILSDSIGRDESDKESLRSLPGKQRLSSEIGMLPKKLRGVTDAFDIGKFESVEARVIARKRSHEEAESTASIATTMGKLDRPLARVLGVPGRPGETLKSVIESDVRKDKANWLLTTKDISLVKKEPKQTSKDKDSAKQGQVSSSSSSSRGDSEHGENELSKLHREKWLLLEKLKQLEDGGSTSDNESTSATEEDVRRVVAKRPRLDEQMALKKDLSKLKGKEELKIKVEKSRNVLGIDVSQSCRKQMEARRRLEKKDNTVLPGPAAGIVINRPSCIVKKDNLITSQIENEETEEMDTGSPPEIPTEFCKKKRKGSEGIGLETGPKTRPYRTKKSDEILSSGDEKDSTYTSEKLYGQEPKKTEKVCDSVDMVHMHQSDHSVDRTKMSEGKTSEHDNSSDTKLFKDKKTLEHQLSISSLSGRHIDVSRETDTVKLLDSSEPVVIPTTVDPSAENLCDPRQQHRKEETVLLPLPMFALKSLSPSHLPSSHSSTSPQFHPTITAPKLQSPCFSPTSTKSQSPMLSPTIQPEPRPPNIISSESKTPSTHISNQSDATKSCIVEMKKNEKETGQADSITSIAGQDQEITTEVSVEERPASPTGLSVEERIRLIDEKLHLYHKYKRKKKSADGSSSIVSYPSSIHRKEPSDMVKNLLSRSSIFDQDRKRLEQIDAKYEPKDVTVSYDSNPVKSVCRTKAAVKEMPTMLSSMAAGSSHCHLPGTKSTAAPGFNSWESSSTNVTLAPVSVTTSLHVSQISSLAKLSPDPSTSSWNHSMNSQAKKTCDVSRHSGDAQPTGLIAGRDCGIPLQQGNFPSGPIPVKRTESASSSGSSAPSASPVTPMAMSWKEGISSFVSSKDSNAYTVPAKKDMDLTHPQLKKESSRDGLISSSSLKRKASHDHDSSRSKEKIAKSDPKSGLSSKASAAARVEEAKAALPKLFEVDKKPIPTTKEKDKLETSTKSDEKEHDKKMKQKPDEDYKTDRKQGNSSKSSKSPEKKLAKLSSTESEEKDPRRDSEKKNSHHSSSKKTDTKSSKPSDSSKDKHKDNKTKHLSKDSSAESDAAECKLSDKPEKKKSQDKDKEKRKEKEKSKSKEKKDREKDHEHDKDKDKGSKDEDKKSEKKDRQQRDKDDKSKSSEQKDKPKKSKDNESSKHSDSSKKRDEKSKSAKHKSSKCEKDKKGDVKGKGKEPEKKSRRDEKKEEKKRRPPPGLTEEDMAVFKEFEFIENESMYDKVKRRSNKDNKEKELEVMRQQLNQLQRSRRQKGKSSRDEETDSSAQNSDEESNASISTASSKRERAEAETGRKKKKKCAVILSSSSDEEDNSSFSQKIFHSEDDEKKPAGKQRSKSQSHSKKAPKVDFLKSDVFSPYSDDEEEEKAPEPEKVKKPPQMKKSKRKSSDASVKQKELISASDRPEPAASPERKLIEIPAKETEEVKSESPLPKACLLEDTSAPYKADSEGSKSDIEEKPKKQKKKKEKKSKTSESKGESKEKSKKDKKLTKEKKKKKDKSLPVKEAQSTLGEHADAHHMEFESAENIPDCFGESDSSKQQESLQPSVLEQTQPDDKEKEIKETKKSTAEEKPVFCSDDCLSDQKSSPRSRKSTDKLEQDDADISCSGKDKHQPSFQSSFQEIGVSETKFDIQKQKPDKENSEMKSFSMLIDCDEAKDTSAVQQKHKKADLNPKKNHLFDSKTSVQKTAEAVFNFNDSDSDDYLTEGRFSSRPKHKTLQLPSSDEDEPKDEIKVIKSKTKKIKSKDLDVAPRFLEKIPLEEQRLFPPILHKVTSEPKFERKTNKTKKKKEKKERKKKDLSPPRDLARVDGNITENHLFGDDFPLDGIKSTEENVVLDEHEGIFTSEVKVEADETPQVMPPESEPLPVVKENSETLNDIDTLPTISSDNVHTASDNTVPLLKEDPVTQPPPEQCSLPSVQLEEHVEATKKSRKKKGKLHKDKSIISENKKSDTSIELDKPEGEKAADSETKYLDVFEKVLAQVEIELENPQETPKEEVKTKVPEPNADDTVAEPISFNEAAEAVNQLLDTENQSLELDMKAQKALEEMQAKKALEEMQAEKAREEMQAEKALQEMQAAVETIKEKPTPKPKRKRHRKDSGKQTVVSFENEIETPALESTGTSVPETTEPLFLEMATKPDEPAIKEDEKLSTEGAGASNEYSAEVQFSAEFEDQKDDESMAMAEDELARAVKVIEDSLAGTDSLEESQPEIFAVEPVQQIASPTVPTTVMAPLPEIKTEVEPTVTTPKKEQTRKSKGKGKRTRGSKEDVMATAVCHPDVPIETTVQSDLTPIPETIENEGIIKEPVNTLPEPADTLPEPEGIQSNPAPPVKLEPVEEPRSEKSGNTKSLLRRGKGVQQQKETDIKDDKRYSVFQFDDKDSDSLLDLEKANTSVKPDVVESSLFETPQKLEKEDEVSPDIQSEPVTPQKEDSKSESEDSVNNRPRRRRKPPPSYKEMSKGSIGLTTRSTSPRSQRATRQTSSPKPFSSPKATTSPKPSTPPKSCITPKAKDFPSPVVKLEKLPEKLPIHGKSLKVEDVGKPCKEVNLDVHHLIAELKARDIIKQEQERQQAETAQRSENIKSVAQNLFPQLETEPEVKLSEDGDSRIKAEQESPKEPRTPRKKRAGARRKKGESNVVREVEEQTLPIMGTLFSPCAETQQSAEYVKESSPEHSEVKSETDELQLSLNSQKSEPEEGNLIIDESGMKTTSELESHLDDHQQKAEQEAVHSPQLGTPIVKQTSTESGCYTPVTPMTPLTPNTPVSTIAPVSLSNIERVIDAVSKGHFDENHLLLRSRSRSRSSEHNVTRSTAGVITSTSSGVDAFNLQQRVQAAGFPIGINHTSPPAQVDSASSHKIMASGHESLSLMNPPSERTDKPSESVIQSTASHQVQSELDRRQEPQIHEPLHVTVGQSHGQRMHPGHPNFHDPQQISPQGRMMPQISPQGHTLAYPPTSAQNMPQISPQGQVLSQASPKNHSHIQSSSQSMMPQQSPQGHQMQLTSPQTWHMQHQQGIMHSSVQTRPIAQASPQGVNTSQASPQAPATLHVSPQNHHSVGVSSQQSHVMPQSPIQSQAQMHHHAQMQGAQQAHMHAKMQAHGEMRAYLAQVAQHQAQAAQMRVNSVRQSAQQKQSSQKEQGQSIQTSSSALSATSTSTVTTTSHGGDKPAVAMQQAVAEGARTQAAFLQPPYMSNNAARWTSSPVQGQGPPAQASAAISHPSAMHVNPKQLPVSTLAPSSVQQRPPSVPVPVVSCATSHAQNRPPSFSSSPGPIPNWGHSGGKEQPREHSQRDVRQADPRLMPPPQSGAPHSHQHQGPIHPVSGSGAQAQHHMGKPGVLIGVVQAQPQTLPPKEASPTGQVIERVPNPVLRGSSSGGVGRVSQETMPMVNHITAHERGQLERVNQERASHERGNHERLSHERASHERASHQRASHEREAEREAQERMNHEHAQAIAAMQHREGVIGQPGHPLAHMQTPPFAHQSATSTFGLHHPQPSELRAALNTPSRIIQQQQQAPPRSMPSHSPTQGHSNHSLPPAHTNTQQPLPAHGGSKSSHGHNPVSAADVHTSLPNNMLPNAHVTHSEVRQREVHSIPAHSREEVRNKLQPAHLQAAFGERRGSIPESDARLRNPSAFVPPDARLTPAEIQKQLYRSELRMPGPNHPPMAFPQGPMGIGVHPRVLYPGAVAQGQHGSYLPTQDGMIAHYQHQHYLAQQAAIQLEQQRQMAENRPPSQPVRPPSQQGQPPPSHAAVLANQGRLSQSPSDGVRSPHMVIGRPLPEGPAHRDMADLMQKYPVTWHGLLALKNDSCIVQMHFLTGNPSLAKLSLPQPGGSNTLRIAQRMRLEPVQLDGVAKRMQLDDEYCMLLAIPSGRDHMDVMAQTQQLTTGFIQYLQQKQAAGIVNVAAPGSQMPAYVVHIFPPCEFSQGVLSKLGYDLVQRLQEIAHMVIVVATV